MPVLRVTGRRVPSRRPPWKVLGRSGNIRSYDSAAQRSRPVPASYSSPLWLAEDSARELEDALQVVHLYFERGLT